VRVEFGAEVPDSAVTVADDGSRADSGASIPEGRPLAAPRGSRTVERVYAPGEQYPVPSWMREVRAGLPEGLALDDGLLLLNGGEVIYAAPDEGALAAPAPVLPGAVRIPIEDFRSMLANLSPGMTVYFY
jgi:hypothetical protein